MSPLPSLRINAYAGEPDTGSELRAVVGPWIGKDITQPIQLMKPGAPADLADWSDSRVGWGLVVPENADIPPAERATANDQPEKIRELLAFRGNGPVLRFVKDLNGLHIRRYDADGKAQDPNLVSAPRGTAKGAIPRYLLIYAPPSEVPWSFQYALNTIAYTGRLDLHGDALANYVDAITGKWAGMNPVVEQPVVWAVDHGGSDITSLMRNAIAKLLHAKLHADNQIGDRATFIDGAAAVATHEALRKALKERQPAFIATTSHGRTGPLDDQAKMRQDIGLLVDGLHENLDVANLLNAWSPSGAIWYAHACCSAGADEQTAYAGLVKPDTFVDRVLRKVATGGATVSPLPQALLGAKRPLRAFVGHVEPTFDCSLRDPKTGQVLTSALVDALYTKLHRNKPIGLALKECYRQSGQLATIHEQVIKKLGTGADVLAEALACRLVATDLASLVILGDPAVKLPDW